MMKGDAREIVQYFFNKCCIDAESKAFARTTAQVNKLLSTYSKQDIINVINHLVDVKHVNIYSFGYVLLLIDETMSLFKKQAAAVHVAEQIAEHAKSVVTTEVKQDGESAKRNTSKASRFGVQPRFGKKSDFNLFT